MVLNIAKATLNYFMRRVSTESARVVQVNPFPACASLVSNFN